MKQKQILNSVYSHLNEQQGFCTGEVWLQGEKKNWIWRHMMDILTWIQSTKGRKKLACSVALDSLCCKETSLFLWVWKEFLAHLIELNLLSNNIYRSKISLIVATNTLQYKKNDLQLFQNKPEDTPWLVYYYGYMHFLPSNSVFF